MFGFGKKKKQAQEPATATIGEVLVAPATGEYKPLNTVSDPVFAGGAMGDGYAVVPSENNVVAPISGKLVLIQNSLHAFAIKSDDGAEVLVHAGVDTVELEGRGFEQLAKVGDNVSAGQAVISVDWDAIRAEIPSTEVMVMVTNTKAFGVATRSDEVRNVSAGEEVANTLRK